MSRVYFSTQYGGTAVLHGSERAYLGGLTNDITLGILNPKWNYRELLPYLAPGSGLASGPGNGHLGAWVSSFESAWAVNMGSFRPGIDPFSISNNTATLIGSDQLRVAAWIHAQCECHGYIEGPQRVWLADIMQEGVDTGVYRDSLPSTLDSTKEISQGWEQVMALLRAADDQPVVMGYFVTDSFPNTAALTEETQLLMQPDDKDEDSRFYDLPADEQWRLGLEFLRSPEANLHALHPDNLATRAYGTTLTAFDLLRGDV